MEVSNARHQIMSSQLENAMSCQNIQGQQEQQQLEKKLRPNPEQSLRCPRCDSSNTKFCYYNNYSLSQPRYFCKGCRRYWTQGGSLRNVPVGGGCRKNKRSSNSSKKSQLDHQDIINTNNPNNPLLAATALPLPPLSYDPNELSLAFATLQHQPMLDCQDSTFLVGNPNPNAAGFLDILRGGFVDNSSSSSGLYYGFGTVGEVEGGGGSGVSGGVMMFPYDAGLMSSTEAVTTTTTATAPTAAAAAAATRTTTTTSTTSQGSLDGADEDKKLMMGLHHHQWALGGDHANLGMDPVRDYWNNGVGPSWPGLINSSLI